MKLTRAAKAVSRRGIRVILLTALLTTVACTCNDNPLSECIAQITHAPCYVPIVTDLSCSVKIQYIPADSDCASCSTCRDLKSAVIDTRSGGSCIPNCQISCPPGEKDCDFLVGAQ